MNYPDKAESIECKVICFDGKVDFITVCSGIAHSAYDVRFNDFYTRDFESLPFVAEYYANSGVGNKKTKQLDELIHA